MLALIIALGIIAVAGPMVVLLIGPEFKVLRVLVAGGIFIWPYATMVQANAPCSYDRGPFPRKSFLDVPLGGLAPPSDSCDSVTRDLPFRPHA
jgi:hypothetical protein